MFLVPVSGTAKPAVLAKLPPVVIRMTAGTFVTRLTGSGETIRTQPYFAALHLEKFSTCWLIIEPSFVVIRAADFEVALGQQFFQSVAPAWAGVDD